MERRYILAYCVDLKAYTLDFKGKAKIPSVKNFILADPDDKETYMLLAKAKENYFLLEAKWPLSLYQVFAIAISSIEK